MSIFNGSPISVKEIVFTNYTDNYSGTVYLNNDKLYFKNSTKEYDLTNSIFNIGKSGNVGLGLSNPGAKFEIQSENLSQLKLSTKNHYTTFEVDDHGNLNINANLNIVLKNSSIKNVLPPTDDNDVVTKIYLNEQIKNVKFNNIVFNNFQKLYDFNVKNNYSVKEIYSFVDLRTKFNIPLKNYIIALTDEITPIQETQNATTFRIPEDIRVVRITASVSKPPSGCNPIKIEIINNTLNKSVLKDYICIKPNEYIETLKLGECNNQLRNNLLLEGEEIIIKITQVGDIFNGRGLKISFVGL
jgi:hypothetical protein